MHKMVKEGVERLFLGEWLEIWESLKAEQENSE